MIGDTFSSRQKSALLHSLRWTIEEYYDVGRGLRFRCVMKMLFGHDKGLALLKQSDVLEDLTIIDDIAIGSSLFDLRLPMCKGGITPWTPPTTEPGDTDVTN